MSFQDVGIREGRPSGATHKSHGRPDFAALAAKQKEKNDRELSGLLYGKLRLVPSSSYETTESDKMGSLEFSSCSESPAVSMESDSPSPLKTSPSPAKATGRLSSLSRAIACSPSPLRTSPLPAKATGELSSPSRGIAGFPTKRRSKNRVDPSCNNRAPLQPRGWSEVAEKSNHSPPPQDSMRIKTPTAFASKHKENSKFSELNTEIKHFSKMVTKLEVLLQQSTESPEVQWRSRILSQSAQEADRDIADKLYWHEKSLVEKGRQKYAETDQTACMKLHRDFRRVHKTLEKTLLEHERRQRADVALLGAQQNDTMMVQQQQEDFFERATREREEEIKNINRNMHKVNEIYKELAVLVESQQEQIGAVQENIHGAKDTVEGGLRHIEYARDRLCAMGDDAHGSPACGGVGDVNAENESYSNRGCTEVQKSDYTRLYPSSVGESEIFHWSMPFQTFHEDIKAVQDDIIGLGKDISSLRLPEKLECGSLSDIQCGGKSDSASVVDTSIFDDGDSI